MKLLAIATLIALPLVPVQEFSAEELLSPRDVRYDCDDKAQLCQISKDDLAYVIGRAELLQRMTVFFYERQKACHPRDI